MNRHIEKWKKKSSFGKVTDFLFLAFIIAMIIPQSRMEIGGFINGLKAKVMQPSVIESAELTRLSEADYEWQLKDVNDKIVNFSDAKGKVIFVNFWATWCPPCVGEMPEIQDLYAQFKDNPNVAFYMVSNETSAKIKQFVTDREFTFPVYAQASAAPAIMPYQSIPTTFIIAKDGSIVVHEVGAAHWGSEKTISIINELIAK